MLNTNQTLRSERYRVIQPLAADENGGLYSAFDNQTQTNVLVREIRGSLGAVAPSSQIAPERERFASTAKRLAALAQESIVPVTDHFSEGEAHFLVSERPDGSTLADFLEKKKSPFPVGDASRWADRLLDALGYLHAQAPSIIHARVTPHHVFLTPSGHVRLLALDLYAEKAASGGLDAAELGFLPLEQIWGGLDVASQKVILTNYDEESERILEEPLDPRSDVYSLGATFYFLLTARVPADALTRSIELLEGKADPLAAPHAVNSSVPPEVSEVVMCALEIRREGRFSSPGIMKQMLRGAFSRFKERQSQNAPQSAVPAAAPASVAAADAPAATPTPVRPAPAVAPETVDARQLELIRRQLREAEQRRVEAERRAAEAEQKLRDAAAATTLAAPAREELIDDDPSEFRTDEFSPLFAEPKPAGGALKKAAGAFVLLAVLGGGGFGVWKMSQTDAAAPSAAATAAEKPAQSMPAPAQPSAETVAQTSVPTPAPTAEQAAKIDSPAPADAKPGETRPADEKPAAPKSSAPVQTAQAKKPASKPEAQKKVTLDDLLNDN